RPDVSGNSLPSAGGAPSQLAFAGYFGRNRGRRAPGQAPDQLQIVFAADSSTRLSSSRSLTKARTPSSNSAWVSRGPGRRLLKPEWNSPARVTRAILLRFPG